MKLSLLWPVAALYDSLRPDAVTLQSIYMNGHHTAMQCDAVVADAIHDSKPYSIHPLKSNMEIRPHNRKNIKFLIVSQFLEFQYILENI